jgi:hypothetical protein
MWGTALKLDAHLDAGKPTGRVKCTAEYEIVVQKEQRIGSELRYLDRPRLADRKLRGKGRKLIHGFRETP